MEEIFSATVTSDIGAEVVKKMLRKPFLKKNTTAIIMLTLVGLFFGTLSFRSALCIVMLLSVVEYGRGKFIWVIRWVFLFSWWTGKILLIRKGKKLFCWIADERKEREREVGKWDTMSCVFSKAPDFAA